MSLAQTNNAQLLGDTIPATMIPGFSYNVRIAFKNTGTTTWTGDAKYKLWCTDGYNFEVYHNEVGLSESVAPGQGTTFEVSFLAPSAGTYSTSWRVIQEGEGAFGDTCRKQVLVAFGPDLPEAPVINSPAAGAVAGSNRPDIRFQGDPCDAFEVHIGSCDLTTSTDGWDSGVVWINSGPNELLAGPGVLNPQSTYFVYARLHNTHGWGPWSASGNWFYTAGQLVNDPYYIAGPSGGQLQHNLCYNPDRNEYLVCYTDHKTGARAVISYYLLDGNGIKTSSEMSIADDLEGSSGANACYNSARHEYLVTYGGNIAYEVQIRVQRIDAATGELIGGSNWMLTTNCVILSKVGYSTRSDSYLLIWEPCGGSPPPIWARRLDSTAVPVGSTFRVSNDTQAYAGNPSMCYNSRDDEFLVTFQTLPDNGPQATWDYYAQRVRASDGALMGDNIVLRATSYNDGNGDVAYDSDMDRYLVVYDESDGEYTPWGQFLSASGAFMGPRFALGGGYYRGGMSGIAWNPVTKEYLAAWGSCCSPEDFAQRISETGELICEPFRTNGYVRADGNWDPQPVANSLTGEFLIAWFWQRDDVYVRRYRSCPLPGPDIQPPAPATGLIVSPDPAGMSLSWTNPPSADFYATMIRAKIGSPPSGPADGSLVIDQAGCAGAADSILHTNAPRGLRVCYAVFAHDLALNFATAATACGTLVGGDFDNDDDVDQDDFGHLQACFSGSGVPPAPGCEDADLERDGDVDQGDLSALIACKAGPGHAPACPP